MRLPTLRELHKWTGLCVGIQILLWALSGLVFSLLDHDRVMAAGVAVPPPAQPLAADLRLLDPAVLLAGYESQRVHEIRLRRVDDRWVYRVAHAEGVALHDARDGTPFVIDEARARALALAHYRGSGRLTALREHLGPTLETRKAGASWQAAFDDPEATSLYFSAQDGALVAARNDSWRVFDFFWMLHTMDYRGRDNFNNPLVILFAFASLWIGLSGLLLLWRVFGPRSRRDPPEGQRA